MYAQIFDIPSVVYKITHIHPFGDGVCINKIIETTKV